MHDPITKQAEEFQRQHLELLTNETVQWAQDATAALSITKALAGWRNECHWLWQTTDDDGTHISVTITDGCVQATDTPRDGEGSGINILTNTRPERIVATLKAWLEA